MNRAYKYKVRNKERWEKEDAYLIPEKKQCKLCNLKKDRIDFFKVRSATDGLTDRCKKCEALYNKEWRHNHPGISLLRGSKQRATLKGIEFNLTLEDLIIPLKCPILGIKLKMNNDKLGPDSFSIDRIDSSKGYIKGNVRIISHRANTLKSNATIQELKLVLKDLEGL